MDTAPDPWPCYGKCIKYHSEAIGSITRTTPPPPVEVVLIFSLLFATYYNMQGKSPNALDHVENGLNIIREWRAPHSPDLGPTKSGTGSEVIEKQIGPVFANWRPPKSRCSTTIPTLFDSSGVWQLRRGSQLSPRCHESCYTRDAII